MFNQIKLRSLLSLFFMTFALTPVQSFSADCDLKDLLKVLKEGVSKRYQKVEFNEAAKEHAKRMKNLGLADASYMVDWKLKRSNQMGPWAMKGNTFVNGIKTIDGNKWMKEVGMKSFGLGFESFPSDVSEAPTAVLRWKNHFFYFGNIQDEFLDALEMFVEPRASFTEATFMATETELQAMRDFIEARVRGELRAKRKIRSSPGVPPYQIGDEIRPEFDFYGDNLFEESCANACTSPFNPKWLEHYDAPKAIQLANLAIKNGIRAEVNSKALVYYNFRNTQASAITVLGLPRGMTQERFIEENYWSEIGGMMWGFIPDRAPGNPSPNYDDVRVPISEWLSRN